VLVGTLPQAGGGTAEERRMVLETVGSARSPWPLLCPVQHGKWGGFFRITKIIFLPASSPRGVRWPLQAGWK